MKRFFLLLLILTSLCQAQVPGAPTNIVGRAHHQRTAALATAPSELIATTVSASQINLNWVDNWTREKGFKVERSIDGTNFAQVAVLVPNSVFYADVGLPASTMYWYRVRSYRKGNINSAYSNVASAITLAAGPTPTIPPIPTPTIAPTPVATPTAAPTPSATPTTTPPPPSPTMTPIPTGGVTLAWDASAGANGYRIYYGPTTGVHPNKVECGNALQFSIPTIGPPQYFVVTAYNAGGESLPSNELFWPPSGAAVPESLFHKIKKFFVGAWR